MSSSELANENESSRFASINSVHKKKEEERGNKKNQEDESRESIPIEFGGDGDGTDPDDAVVVDFNEIDLNSNIVVENSCANSSNNGHSNDLTSTTVIENVNENGAETRTNNTSDTSSSSSLSTKSSSCRQVTTIQTAYSIWSYFSFLNFNSNEIEEIEKNMLKATKCNLERYYVNIRNDSLKIWTISANTNSTNVPLVLVHGFCGGVGLWVHNIDPLAENHPFYAFDLLGFGRSSRPSFSTDPIVAEAQFVESIEDWRKALNLPQMILLGHSFGGYLVCAYALKYPDKCKALILADPWGFPIENVNGDKQDTPRPLWVSAIAKASQFVSPLSFVRVTGRVGVSVFKYLRPDFKKKYRNVLDPPELVYDYLYSANRLNPTGEAGFRAIANYFGFAKNPMIKRIEKIKPNIPIWFIYGSRSWIDSSAGFTAVYLRQRFAPISVKLVTGAGHHVYADRPDEFNEYVKYVLEIINECEELSDEFVETNESSSVSAATN